MRAQEYIPNFYVAKISEFLRIWADQLHAFSNIRPSSRRFHAGKLPVGANTAGNRRFGTNGLCFQRLVRWLILHTVVGCRTSGSPKALLRMPTRRFLLFVFPEMQKIHFEMLLSAHKKILHVNFVIAIEFSVC